MIYEIDTINKLESLIKKQDKSENLISINFIFQGLNILPYEKVLEKTKFKKCVFLGCTMSTKFHINLINLEAENFIIPELNKPYKIFVNSLYTVDFLYDKFDMRFPSTYHDTHDYKIFQHYKSNGKHQTKSLIDELSMRLHDSSISDTLEEFIDGWGERGKNHFFYWQSSIIKK